MHGVGIIGAGSVSTGHLRAVTALESTHLQAVADTDAERLARVCAEHGCQGYASYEDVLADEGVDLVIVCLPHGLHCEVTVAALEAGKHVLVEKPMAVNVEQCDAMIAAAQRTGKQLSVGHMHRFSPTNRAVQKLLREQAVGESGLSLRRGLSPLQSRIGRLGISTRRRTGACGIRTAST